MRVWIVAALEVGGIAAVVIGVWMIYPPIAVIVAGAGAVGVGYAIDVRSQRRRRS